MYYAVRGEDHGDQNREDRREYPERRDEPGSRVALRDFSARSVVWVIVSTAFSPVSEPHRVHDTG